MFSLSACFINLSCDKAFHYFIHFWSCNLNTRFLHVRGFNSALQVACFKNFIPPGIENIYPSTFLSTSPSLGFFSKEFSCCLPHNACSPSSCSRHPRVQKLAASAHPAVKTLFWIVTRYLHKSKCKTWKISFMGKL